MILPEGHEDMSDAELVAALVDAGLYDRAAAEAIVAAKRGYGPPLD